jgi:hypothetical protein
MIYPHGKGRPATSRKARLFDGGGHWGWTANGAALALIIGLALLPFVLHGKSTPPWVQAAQKTSPIPLAGASASLPGVALSPIATPVNPEQAPAGPPTADPVRSAALVAGEDLRLRQLIHHIGRLAYPVVMPAAAQLDPTSTVLRSTTPTLVLPGPSSYTISDLKASGAALPLVDGGYMLVDNILVGPGATLTLGGPSLPTLLMASGTGGFTSLVDWGGTLTLAGAGPDAPLTIIGWDRAAGVPAKDGGYGRPYIRAVGGRLDLRYVRVSSLGFWSGRTGGVSWTGISTRMSTGSAVSSQFVGNAYGAFVSRASGIQFKDDLFESNELDGLRLHRNASNSTVTLSASARNGGNGFVVSRGATGNVLQNDVAVNNSENGFLLIGLPLTTGASPSGSRSVASIGTTVEYSEARDNARTGILVEGGAGTIIRQNIVFAKVTGMAVRAGATNTLVVGNEVRGGGRIALAIGPAVIGTTIDANTLSNARIGLLIRNSAGVRIINNHFAGISVFGISVRGSSPGVVGNDNVIAGRGFQPIDTRGGAQTPTMTGNNTSGWQHRSSLSLIGELRYHPILDTWLLILTLVVVSSLVARLRRRPERPYSYSVPWRPAAPAAPATNGLHAIEPAVLAEADMVAGIRRRRRRRRRALAAGDEAAAMENGTSTLAPVASEQQATA